jgi:hypothetical protein
LDGWHEFLLGGRREPLPGISGSIPTSCRTSRCSMSKRSNPYTPIGIPIEERTSDDDVDEVVVRAGGRGDPAAFGAYQAVRNAVGTPSRAPARLRPGCPSLAQSYSAPFTSLFRLGPMSRFADVRRRRRDPVRLRGGCPIPNPMRNQGLPKSGLTSSDDLRGVQPGRPGHLRPTTIQYRWCVWLGSSVWFRPYGWPARRR